MTLLLLTRIVQFITNRFVSSSYDNVDLSDNDIIRLAITSLADLFYFTMITYLTLMWFDLYQLKIALQFNATIREINEHGEIYNMKTLFWILNLLNYSIYLIGFCILYFYQKLWIYYSYKFYRFVMTNIPAMLIIFYYG